MKFNIKKCPFCKNILPTPDWNTCAIYPRCNEKKMKKINREKMFIWRNKNPDKVKSIKHKYRSNLYKAKGSYSYLEWENLKKKFKNRCAICKRKEPFKHCKNPLLTVDHIKPLSKGGTNYIKNIQPLCISCNCSKSDKFDNKDKNIHKKQ